MTRRTVVLRALPGPAPWNGTKDSRAPSHQEGGLGGQTAAALLQAHTEIRRLAINAGGRSAAPRRGCGKLVEERYVLF
eukprot:gene16477-biopygen23274